MWVLGEISYKRRRVVRRLKYYRNVWWKDLSKIATNLKGPWTKCHITLLYTKIIVKLKMFSFEKLRALFNPKLP